MPGVCDGSKIGGMCMSEPNAGTDVLGMRSNAVFDPSRNGYVLNGAKMWITNGTLTGKETGDLFLVYARTGSEKRSDITQFIVEGGMEGFSVGQKINDKLGMRASPTAELVFENVFVPNSNVVGEVNGATLCMMRNLEIERVALAAMAVGIARRALDEMIAYASNRPAFGKPNLYAFGQIQKHITESYAEYMAGKVSFLMLKLCDGINCMHITDSYFFSAQSVTSTDLPMGLIFLLTEMDLMLMERSEFVCIFWLLFTK